MPLSCSDLIYREKHGTTVVHEYLRIHEVSAHEQFGLWGINIFSMFGGTSVKLSWRAHRHVAMLKTFWGNEGERGR